MIERLFNIFGGVASFYASIEYIVSVIFSKIMFDILGVRSGLAFIPFYNTYRIYKEYKGRVWKRNWGVAYIITFAIPMVVIGGFVFALFNLPITSGKFYEEFATTLILVLVVLIIAGLVISVFNFILLFSRIIYIIFSTFSNLFLLFLISLECRLLFQNVRIQKNLCLQKADLGVPIQVYNVSEYL